MDKMTTCVLTMIKLHEGKHGERLRFCPHLQELLVSPSYSKNRNKRITSSTTPSSQRELYHHAHQLFLPFSEDGVPNGCFP